MLLANAFGGEREKLRETAEAFDETPCCSHQKRAQLFHFSARFAWSETGFERPSKF